MNNSSPRWILILVSLTLVPPLYADDKERGFDLHDGIDLALEAMEAHRVLGIGEHHSMRDDDAFVLSLLEEESFPSLVDDIVLEAANALYQPILDRYVSGEQVSIEELSQVWRHTTHCVMGVEDCPFYVKLLEKVRALNQKGDDGSKLRVLAGDPPIDWSSVSSPEDWRRFMNRDEHFARVVIRESLDRDRKALLVVGGGHLIRTQGDNVIGRLEQHLPGETFVMQPLSPDAIQESGLQSMCEDWETPSAFLVKGTPLEQTQGSKIFPGNLTMRNGKVFAAYSDVVAVDMIDALLFLGGPQDLDARDTFVPFDDPAYRREIEKRKKLVGVRALPADH